jgi:hypothetical protein
MFEYRNFYEARKANPTAAIIRRLDEGRWIAFQNGQDAIGHPSTAMQPKQGV